MKLHSNNAAYNITNDNNNDDNDNDNNNNKRNI